MLLSLLAVGPVSATHVVPEKVLGNPTCEDLGYGKGVKVDPPEDGTYDVGEGTVEIEITGDGEFTWTSDGTVVLAVIVKGGAETPQEGPSANVYRYNPPATTTDDGLHAPHGFSHIEICFEDETPPPPPTPELTIEKSNDAPGVGEAPLEDGDTVAYKLDYDLTDGPVANGVIEDVLPDGVTYVDGSATDSANGEFVFDGYDAGSRTLTWLATEVTEDGSVTYEGTIDEGAAELQQPLTNTACIDSDDTDEDCAESDVFVGEPPAGETSVPTGPQTDVVGTSGTAEPNGSLLIVLLALAAIAVTVAFVAPSPKSIRRRLR